MGDVLRLVPPNVGMDRGWAQEKAEMLIDGLRLAIERGVDPESLRVAAWNATKILCWFSGEKWSPAMADDVLRHA